jgi:transposase InsO family protein
MEAVYYAARGNLRRLLQQHPSWTRAQLAQATGMSLSWVSKWKKRLASAPAADEQVLRSLSRAPQHPPPRLDPLVVDRLLEMRDQPPEGLGRTPGPKALLYYLPRDESLQQAGLRLPRSTRSIHRLLREHGRIAPRLPHAPDPIERPQPMEQWQLDFKDASTVPAEPEGKQQHVVETLNIIDKGTSVLLESLVRSDFTAATALQAVAHTFQEQGLPGSITLDRDTRWVGAPQGADFPAAVLRFCQSLGVAVLVCDPHHPQQNGFVERYHRTYQEECLSQHRPTTLSQVRQVTTTFREHYNWQRPQEAHRVWQPPSAGGLSRVAQLTQGARCGQCRCLAFLGRWGACSTSGEPPGLCQSGFAHLLRLQQTGRTSGDLAHQCQRRLLAGGVSTGKPALAPTERAASA